MPITQNSKIIQKYVPEKHISGASVEIDNSGYLLLRDNFISVFPSIMEYKEKSIFSDEKENLLKIKWAAYIVFRGHELFFISSKNTFSSLEEEVNNSDFNLWHTLPSWYLAVIKENESKIVANLWDAYFQNDIISYMKLQHEYGYMQHESKKDKSLLFPKNRENRNVFVETLNLILSDKVMRGELTQTQKKDIISRFKDIS